MDDEDGLLVTQCLNGDGKAFERIIEKYYKPVYRLASRLVKYSDDAEEITQSAFVKAYEKLNTYNSKFKFFSWIYRITINESLNFLKERSHTSEVTENTLSGIDNPDVIYDQIENSKKIEDALFQLDMLYRLPVVLKHFMSYSYKELSDLLDIPEKTVKSRLFTGRQLLKDILIKNGLYEK